MGFLRLWGVCSWQPWHLSWDWPVWTQRPLVKSPEFGQPWGGGYFLVAFGEALVVAPWAPGAGADVAPGQEFLAPCLCAAEGSSLTICGLDLSHLPSPVRLALGARTWHGEGAGSLCLAQRLFAEWKSHLLPRSFPFCWPGPSAQTFASGQSRGVSTKDPDAPQAQDTGHREAVQISTPRHPCPPPPPPTP